MVPVEALNAVEVDVDQFVAPGDRACLIPPGFCSRLPASKGVRKHATKKLVNIPRCPHSNHHFHVPRGADVLFSLTSKWVNKDTPPWLAQFV